MSGITSISTPPSIKDLSGKSSTPTSSCSNSGWAFNYKLSAEIFSDNIRKSLQGNIRIKAKLRRQLVREFVHEITREQGKPSRKSLEILANRLVSQFPILKETLDGNVIGSGCEGLVLKLVRRVENENRKDDSNSAKRKKKSLNFESEVSLKKAKASEDSYGCISFAPNIEDRDLLIKNKEELIELYQTLEGRSRKKEIEEKMEATYALLREDINDGSSLLYLVTQWPFLFSANALDNHFRLLMGKSAIASLTNSLENKAQRILNFMEDNGGRDVQHVLYDVASESKKILSDQPKVAGAILAIMAFFGEKNCTLFECIEVYNNCCYNK
jgi:hypothetical protein